MVDNNNYDDINVVLSYYYYGLSLHEKKIRNGTNNNVK